MVGGGRQFSVVSKRQNMSDFYFAIIPNYSQTEDYDPPCRANFIVVVSAATAVATTLQIFIVVVTACYAVVTTTLQKFIVVVSAATAVATTVQKFIVVG